MAIDGEQRQRLPPAAQEVLHDLIAVRGLVDEQLHYNETSGVWLIMGSALLEKLQDNRLQRKRKHHHHKDTASDGAVGDGELRKHCVFVVVNTAQEPATSMQRLLELHTVAATAAAESGSRERVYLSLVDAGSISYYHLEPGFQESIQK